MENLLLWIGRFTGFVGVLVCAIAVAARATGTFTLGGFQVGTMLQAGMAAMILACFCYSAAIVERTPK